LRDLVVGAASAWPDALLAGDAWGADLGMDQIAAVSGALGASELSHIAWGSRAEAEPLKDWQIPNAALHQARLSPFGYALHFQQEPSEGRGYAVTSRAPLCTDWGFRPVYDAAAASSSLSPPAWSAYLQ